MVKSSKTIGFFVISIALGTFLLVSGILTVQLDAGLIGRLQAGLGGNEIASAVYTIAEGDIANALIIALGIFEIIAGVFIFINIIASTGKIANVCLCVIMILWIVVIFLVDIQGAGGLLNGAFDTSAKALVFLKTFSSHLLVLGAILSIWKK